MLRITELKLPLTALPLDVRRASDAPSETDEDREPLAHPVAALTALVAGSLGGVENAKPGVKIPALSISKVINFTGESLKNTTRRST